MAGDDRCDEVYVDALVASDIAGARALWQATENLGLGDSDAPEALTVFIARNPGLSAVARDPGADERIVGAVLCGHDGRRGALYHLAVAGTHRRRGIGAALVSHCRRGLVAAGIQRCNLLIYPHNHAGRAFWESHGWQTRPWELMQSEL